MKSTLYSLLASTGSVVSATATGDKVLTIVTIIINSIILLSNALLDVYRKWRDRDKDLEEPKDKEE